jgi:antitoxin YefM
MDTVKATEARAKLYGLIDQVEQSHEPVLITGKRSNAVLIAEDDWKSVQETLYLLSLPGMRESLIQGVSTPTLKLKKSLPW